MTSVAATLDNSHKPDPSDLLKYLVQAGSLLVGVSKPKAEESSRTLTDVIKTRLVDFNHASSTIPGLTPLPEEIEYNDLENLKLVTAYKSLEVVEQIQSLLQEHDVDLPANNKESTTAQGMVSIYIYNASSKNASSCYWNSRPWRTKNASIHRFWLGCFPFTCGFIL